MDENLQEDNNGFFSWDLPGAVDFNAFLSQDEDAPNCGAIANAQSTSALSSPAIDAPTDPAYLCTGRMTELLLDTSSLWARMPVKSTLHLAQRNSHDEHVKNLTDKIASKAALEGIFALTQRLTDLYPDALSIAVPPATGNPPACSIPDCTHSLELPPALGDIERHVSPGLQGGARGRADLALANTLASCHARLLDVVDCFFLLVTSCIRVTVASPDRREPEFSGPDMRVGSFVPPKTAAASMQIALLKHLLVGLSDRLASFGEAVSSRAGGLDGGGMETQILALQHQLLTKRHTSCLEHVGTVQDFLMGYDAKNL